MDIYHKIRLGDYSESVFLGSAEEEVVDESESSEAQSESPVDVKTQSFKERIEDLKKNQKKASEDKLTPGMYRIKIHQLTSKAEKYLKIIRESIKKYEELYEQKTDLPGYVNRKKSAYEKICRELEIREKLRRDSKNRKAYEFALLLKTGDLTEEEIAYKKKILEAEDFNIDEKLIIDKNVLLEEISKFDPIFHMRSSNTLDLMEGKNLNRTMINIDLFRVGEILFEPSVVGSNQMGIGEILENILNNHNIKNIFITGGFSQIEGLKERIIFEANKYSQNGPVNVNLAMNPSHDAFKGAFFSDLFPIYTYEEYLEKGIDGLFVE
ncbi:actin family protein [Nosema bombycis CQ1]|uniref:Actin family protein n=1 Tax=Nosema bombycis (strain CQ1 / CVCC 102059) TaxID=578461 RepID=R0MK31_NOSB1|nr:actin family protein [Nosema bombycis CQ1]|eukprot:EOB14595.1 actin family protein [Nosema bombycis CQ1]